MAHKWSELKHKFSAEEMLAVKARAAATLERMQLHELRKMRRQTQKALANTTGMAQSEISRIETRTNLTLNTLDAYVRGLGGQLEVRAVFPEQTIAIEVPREQEQPAERAA